MNDAIEPPSHSRKPLFNWMTAEFMFERVERSYFQGSCTDEKIKERTDGVVVGLVARELRERGRGTSPEELARANREVRAFLTNYRANFARDRDHFFFVDLFPENAARFNITIEQCWPGEPLQ
jgi:hypothetical protein